MRNAFAIFQKNIQEAKKLSAIYMFLAEQNIPLNGEDLLRSELVYGISALDKLVHDIIRIGMIQIFLKKRTETPKYLQNSISLSSYQKLSDNQISEQEKIEIFERIIVEKLKIQSFQDPEKIADGLSLIWEEKQKWYQIAQYLKKEEKIIKAQLKLIVSRRNSIVHEADMDFQNEKIPIFLEDSQGALEFLSELGNAIFDLVNQFSSKNL